ncbi:MAG: phosphoglycerate dehydrogenase [Faecalimonas sp.]|nr:phosphoglycerate dehydrogenase [Faecalimonas sp.]
MYQYHCLNAIAGVGLAEFSEDYVATEQMENADAVLVRSAAMHEIEFSKNLKAIARAGAGVNNIPLERCAEEGIVVFNTPGANANGVKELVIAGLFLASRDVVGGIDWVKANAEDENIAKSAEKAKKAFAGCELAGKKLGVIGLGAIGILVANTACSLGMEVYGYDPYLSVDSAWKLSRDVVHAKSVEELYRACDYITIHVPALDSTKGMINKEAIEIMKDDVVILNFARDVLVNEDAMAEALASGKVKRYVTDFPNPRVVGMKNTIVIPHLGASTEESEDNCAKMAVQELREFLENGNIRNSVNYPNCDMGPRGDKKRITILHRNQPSMLVKFTNVFSEDGINISDMTNKSKNEYAYTIMDVHEITEEIIADLKKIPDVLGVRVIA